MQTESIPPVYDALHIGRSKCASTYLQQTALAAHPEIDLVFADHKNLFHQYWNYDFGDSPEGFVEQIRNTPLSDPKPDSSIRVFSHETLCGNMATGRDARLIADLTFEAFGDIRAFIIVREPYSYIYSVWNQYIQEGGVLSFKQYLQSEASPTWNRDKKVSRLWQTSMNADLIHYWSEKLGREQFSVFLLEDLIRDSRAFWRSIYSFLGVDSEFVPPPTSERTSFPYSLATLKRLSNFILKTHHNPGGLLPVTWHPVIRNYAKKVAPKFSSKRPVDARTLVPPEIKELIRLDNVALAAYLDRDLSELGYAL